MRITVLAGGVGAARFLRGLRRAAPDSEITVIGNTGDDITLFGLRVCPDLDTVMYTLDRKSTRLNSSHQIISYAVFCLKKKKTTRNRPISASHQAYM